MKIFLSASFLLFLTHGFVKAGTCFCLTDTIKSRVVKHKTLTRRQREELTIRNKNPDDDCIFTNRLTTGQRLSKYPFSKAVKIVAVSYPACCWPTPEVIIGDTTPKLPDSVICEGLNVKEGKLYYSSLIEIKTLSKLQIELLTNIIYNTRYKKPYTYRLPMPGYSCFMPRNALVFFDKNGKVFDYLEICFECRRFESLSDKISIGTGCNQKLDLLKKYLVDLGSKYGTVAH